jgi:hypothetical protein
MVNFRIDGNPSGSPNSDYASEKQAGFGLLSSFVNCFRTGRSARNGSKEEDMASSRRVSLGCVVLAAGFCSLCLVRAQAFQSSPSSSPPAVITEHDGSHDFDFLSGNWKAHVRRLPDRLNGSDTWDVYDGISNHKKLLDSNANFEEFEVDSPAKHLHMKAQTLRLYNPASHQWSIYLLDLDKGEISASPVVGQFIGDRGEFFHQEELRGRVILVRYVWLNISPRSARMEQSYSPDGGKNWEVNWICELSRP